MEPVGDGNEFCENAISIGADMGAPVVKRVRAGPGLPHGPCKSDEGVLIRIRASNEILRTNEKTAGPCVHRRAPIRFL